MIRASSVLIDTVLGASKRTSSRTVDDAVTCPSTAGTSASPAARLLKMPPEAPRPRVQVALFTRIVPVTIGDARVCPGDLLRGDADGVVVIPAAHEAAVLAAAEEIDSAEREIRNAVSQGKTLAEARKHLGYHQLQSRKG